MDKFFWTCVKNVFVVTLATGVDSNQHKICPAHMVNCIPSDNRKVPKNNFDFSHLNDNEFLVKKTTLHEILPIE